MSFGVVVVALPLVLKKVVWAQGAKVSQESFAPSETRLAPVQPHFALVQPRFRSLGSKDLLHPLLNTFGNLPFSGFLAELSDCNSDLRFVFQFVVVIVAVAVIVLTFPVPSFLDFLVFVFWGLSFLGGGILNSTWNYNSHETTTFGCSDSTFWGPKAVTALKWRLLHQAIIEMYQLHSQQPPNYNKSEPTAVKWQARNSTRSMRFCVVSWLLSFHLPLRILWLGSSFFCCVFQLLFVVVVLRPAILVHLWSFSFALGAFGSFSFCCFCFSFHFFRGDAFGGQACLVHNSGAHIGNAREHRNGFGGHFRVHTFVWLAPFLEKERWKIRALKQF